MKLEWPEVWWTMVLKHPLNLQVRGVDMAHDIRMGIMYSRQHFENVAAEVW